MIFLAGFIFAVISLIIRNLGAAAGMRFYAEPDYFPVWSRLMVALAGTPQSGFLLYSSVFALVTGIFFVLVYTLVRKSVPGRDYASKGAIYGILVFLVGGFPATLFLYLTINLPGMLIWLWALEGLLIDVIGGLATASLLK